MRTLSITLPARLETFVGEQIDRGGDASSSDYLNDLIRRDKDRERLRALLIDGATADPSGEMDDDYFIKLRERVAPSPGA